MDQWLKDVLSNYVIIELRGLHAAVIECCILEATIIVTNFGLCVTTVSIFKKYP